MTTALNHVGGGWQPSGGADFLDVHNPATAAAIGRVVLSAAHDLDAAVEAATAAAREWRNTPVEDRIQPLFRLKALMDERLDELARVITQENGKTLAESVGELKRAIENVEVACGTPTLMQGDFLEDVASGIDEMMIRQPVGVCAIICPFNFPAMIPFWFLPYALACGNTCIIKPSERTPLTMRAVFELLEEAGFPARRGQPGQRRPPPRRRDPGASGHQSGELRRLHAGGQTRLRHRVGRWQAGAGAGRRQEPRSWCCRTPTST